MRSTVAGTCMRGPEHLSLTGPDGELGPATADSPNAFSVQLQSGFFVTKAAASPKSFALARSTFLSALARRISPNL